MSHAACLALDVVKRRSLSGRGAEDLHRRLAFWNRERLAPGERAGSWVDAADRDHAMALDEGAYIEAFREEAAALACAAPVDPDAFVSWFEALKAAGPGQNDPLFPWLADQATLEDVRWFLRQETAGEAGFDDLVAMTQVKLPAAPKLELARNYWDEMGRGAEGGMHGPMLERTAALLDLSPSIETTLWPSLALANTMTAFAATRRYAYHSVGALGVVELTAPGRVAQVAAGLKRLGIDARARKYFDLHAVLDVKHSADWNAEAIRPLVSANPALARPIAEGAVMRLMCGARCFDAYRLHFGI